MVVGRARQLGTLLFPLDRSCPSTCAPAPTRAPSGVRLRAVRGLPHGGKRAAARRHPRRADRWLGLALLLLLARPGPWHRRRCGRASALRRGRSRPLNTAANRRLAASWCWSWAYAAMDIVAVLAKSPPRPRHRTCGVHWAAHSLYVRRVVATLDAFATCCSPWIAVPVAEAAGWQVSLGGWALVAAVSLVPWIACSRIRNAASSPRRCPRRPTAGAAPGDLARRWRGRSRSCFAVPGFNAYALFAWLPTILRDTAGTFPAQVGALLALYAAMGLPCELRRARDRGALRPRATARRHRDRRVRRSATSDCILGPATATWLWVALAGIGPLLFPARARARQPAEPHALGRGRALGIRAVGGYLIVAVGPLAVGLLHEPTERMDLALRLPAGVDVPAAIELGRGRRGAGRATLPGARDKRARRRRCGARPWCRRSDGEHERL